MCTGHKARVGNGMLGTFTAIALNQGEWKVAIVCEQREKNTLLVISYSTPRQFLYSLNQLISSPVWVLWLETVDGHMKNAYACQCDGAKDWRQLQYNGFLHQTGSVLTISSKSSCAHQNVLIGNSLHHWQFYILGVLSMNIRMKSKTDLGFTQANPFFAQVEPDLSEARRRERLVPLANGRAALSFLGPGHRHPPLPGHRQHLHVDVGRQ